MPALQHLSTFAEAIRAPEVFTKSAQKRDVAKKALESVNILAKGELAWDTLAMAWVQFGKVFDPHVGPKDTAVAHAKLARMLPVIARQIPVSSIARDLPPRPISDPALTR